MNRDQKEKVVEELGQIFETSGAVVVAHYDGLTVAEMTTFRHRLRQVGGAVRVAKNRLAKIALKDHPAEGMGALLTGMTVFAYAEDPVAAAKAVEDYAKENQKLQILGGMLGPQVLDRAGVTAVSKMPSREEVIGSLVSMLFAPGQGVAGAIGGPGAGVAGAIGAPGAAIAGAIASVEAKAA